MKSPKYLDLPPLQEPPSVKLSQSTVGNEVGACVGELVTVHNRRKISPSSTKRTIIYDSKVLPSLTDAITTVSG